MKEGRSCKKRFNGALSIQLHPKKSPRCRVSNVGANGSRHGNSSDTPASAKVIDSLNSAPWRARAQHLKSKATANVAKVHRPATSSQSQGKGCRIQCRGRGNTAQKNFASASSCPASKKHSRKGEKQAANASTKARKNANKYPARIGNRQSSQKRHAAGVATISWSSKVVDLVGKLVHTVSGACVSETARSSASKENHASSSKACKARNDGGAKQQLLERLERRARDQGMHAIATSRRLGAEEHSSARKTLLSRVPAPPADLPPPEPLVFPLPHERSALPAPSTSRGRKRACDDSLPMPKRVCPAQSRHELRSVLIQKFGLSAGDFAPQYDYTYSDQDVEGMTRVRGGESYQPPKGFTKLALNVDRYGDASWLNKKHGWVVAYHGTFPNEATLKSIIRDGLKIRGGRHKPTHGRRFGEGIYLTPTVDLAARYARELMEVDGGHFHVIFQCRVRPNSFERHFITKDAMGELPVWLVRDSLDVRPCGILLGHDELR